MNDLFRHLGRLDPVDRFLNLGIDILDPEADPVEAQLADHLHPLGIGLAGIDLDRVIALVVVTQLEVTTGVVHQLAHLVVADKGRGAAAPVQLVDYPVTGIGFGTFREVAPRYMQAGSSKRFNRAHNDYVEVVSDGGVITGVLVLWLSAAFGMRAARRVRRHNGTLSASRLGLALGLASLCLHALVDFNHQIPANALLFVSMAAMLVTVPVGGRRS